ncbi:MAG: SigE family RNA polymerase sigma factor [Jatrophihabitans sp.]|uniref:SigE family RNA polymerase sigma factor n=1 Tax=Jatrophihabitans sp. TaxID=1932789 RepID=UPI003910ADC3
MSVEFSEYVQRERPALLRFATVLAGQTWLAEDLVSNVLGRAFERWTQIAGLANPHAYVRRMIVNEHLSWRRRLRRSASFRDMDAHIEAVPDTTGPHAERDAMLVRLAKLPSRQRAPVVLRYYVGLSDMEIAAELGCRPGTVRSQISRALTSLRIDASGSRAAEPLELR